MGIIFRSPEQLRALFNEAIDREKFLHDVEPLTKVKIIWGQAGQKVSGYSPLKNKILLSPKLKTASNEEFLCTVAHEFNHAGHRRRTLLTALYALICMIAIAATFLVVFEFNSILTSIVIVGVFVPLGIRVGSFWELQAEAFAADTIGLETRRALYEPKKKLLGWRRAVVKAFLPHLFYENIEKLVKERNF